ncbi:hypothetical protein P7H70_02180 [Vagococcus carniphilus]|uniref:Uncharacterized protein n=1 Tax=Vagococcus carniphilus TaxID=218144 RepID=A0AAW8U3F4_9ENTE|nr:hypothetical protein [Vagococcus carniphilus]MDT2832849.1 hypothetical protein [Vagococcus carniphilus]
MSKVMIVIGSIIDYPTVHNKKVVGKVELILENTLLIRDSVDETHLVLKSSLEQDGYSIDEKTYVNKRQFTNS